MGKLIFANVLPVTQEAPVFCLQGAAGRVHGQTGNRNYVGTRVEKTISRTKEM